MASPLSAVQVRLMGEKAAVEAVADDLVRRGLMAVTGSSQNRKDGGWRIYGVMVANEIAGSVTVEHPALESANG